MKRLTKLLSTFLAICLVAGLLPAKALADSSMTSGSAGFYHVSGQSILNENSEKVLLKGMSFGNTNYGNPPDISQGPNNDHDASSYYELAAMGMDHVRFEFNYGLFEDDSAPCQYKQAGFDWLDQNIAWAKAAGIHLIFEMKHPQGGYQASVRGMGLDGNPDNGGKALWMGENYIANQNRLVALWTEIARRYANEPTVIGYGLVNEPVVPQVGSNAQATLDQWKDLAQRIADGIRTVDQNHILFVECLLTHFKYNDYDGTDWNLLSLQDKQFLINDNNTVYEFHFYEPFEFTSQGAFWMEQYEDMVNSYPSDTVIKADVDWSRQLSLNDPARAVESENGWTRYERSYTANSSDGFIYTCPIVTVPSGSGDVYVDDIFVTRTGSDGSSKELYSYSFEDGLGRWADTWALTHEACTGIAHSGNGSLHVYGSSSQWSNTKPWDWFYISPDSADTYTVSAWIKDGSPSSVEIGF